MNQNWKSVCLDGNWELFIEENRNLSKEEVYKTEKELKKASFLHIIGTVPGNFELDMQREGLIPDLFYSTQVLEAKKLENRHLWYTTHFVCEDTDRERFIRFEGIDTFSEIYLNGKKIGETDNMLVPYEFEASGLRSGENELVVHIIPVFVKSRENTFEAGISHHQAYNADSVTVRKAPHMFGWDIMPRILSGGIWRSVYLFEKPETRIDEIYFSTIRVREDLATLHVYFKTHINDDFLDNYTLCFEGECQESHFYFEKKMWHTEGRTFIHIKDPKLWWPKGMGDPNLYSVTASLKRGGELIDQYKVNVGLRIAKLQKTDVIEEDGSGEFLFTVNGEKMFVRGTNWVPLDAFHSRDKERLSMALDLLEESNCNMVRCWGGNVYEQDEFFDYCDRHGIAIWQDFAMACSFYPQDDEFCAVLKKEAETVVTRLRNHTSIFLWVGDNECDITISGWHPVRQNPNFNKLTREVLPEVIRRLDPFRDYLPSSPYISKEAFDRGMERRVPEYHLWGPRGHYKADYYSNAVCRFASETGYHGCPDVSSVKRFIAPDKTWPWQDNPDWFLHATNMEYAKNAAYAARIKLMDQQIFCLFGFHPQSLEEFVTASQITQAEADKYFVERFRLGKWQKTTGILIWNLIDGWPQFSDSVVDYYGRKKAAFTVLKRVQEPVCLIFREPQNNRLTLACANDCLRGVTVKYKIIDITHNKTVKTGEATVEKNITQDIAEIICNEQETTFYLCEWEFEGKSYCNHYLCGKGTISYESCLEGYRKCGIELCGGE